MKDINYSHLTEKKKEWELMNKIINELIQEGYNYRKYKQYRVLSGLSNIEVPTFGQYLFGFNYK